MENIPLYPLRLQPVYKDYIWGGNKIAAQYKRGLPPGIYAESWEIADRPEGMSVVVNGPLAGRDLFSLTKAYGERLMGWPFTEFPLLLKIIDAKDKLSLQVHPDEAGARDTGGDPKTEMWYVLSAEPGAKVYLGFKPGVTPAAFKQALVGDKVGDLLEEIRVARGDVILIPGGKIHAIGPGCLLLEVMQNSNTTFRLFDWNRKGRDGQPRALQVNKALKVIHWDDARPAKIDQSKVQFARDPENNAVAELLHTPYFKFEKLIVAGLLRCAPGGKTFHALFVEEGAALLSSASETMPLESGMTVLVPADLPEYSLKAQGGKTTVLRISLP